jgi:putative ABC transport system permease protein
LIAAAAFAYWPLAAARRASAASLFRSRVETRRSRLSRRDMGVVAALALAFFGLAIALAGDREVALIFAGSGLAAYAALRIILWGLIILARRYWRPIAPMTRLAAANLTRPGASTSSVAVSLGLGLTLLAAVSLIDANLSKEVTNSLPERAPALFFSDIPYADAERFDARMKELAEGAAIERFFMMRAGVAKLNGKPLEQVEGAANSAWARANNWSMTILDEIPEDMGEIVSGQIWPKDYAGPPRLVLSDRQAEQFKLAAGDTITLSIAGREITAEIVGTYRQNWERNGLNFVAIFAPGTLEAARPTSVGILRTGDLDLEARVTRALAQEFPETAVIRARDVIETVRDIIAAIGFVIRSLSGLTIAAGVIVLLGAVAADFARKLKDAMIMKTVGASRRRILTAYAIEYAVIGAAPALAAIGLGLVGSWFVVAKQMEIAWRPAPLLVSAIVAGAVAVTMIIGLAAAARVLNARPWPVLRSE